MQNHMNKRDKETIAKEIFFGVLAIGLGAYNLLSQFGVLNWGFEIPQLIGNILLVVVGFTLWATAFKLWRYKFHTRGLF
ncbi:hypothetical protein JW826_05785 [Candidatus Woesearchaeota archaeon]|nr:hypothetical protein [Candidatus Woesearchaeota archaeon]